MPKMRCFDRLSPANTALRIKRANNKVRKANNEKKLLKSRIEKLEQINIKKNHKIEEYVEKETTVHQRVVEELDKLANVKHPNLRRYTPYICMIALGLMILHLPSFEYMRKFLPFPSRQTLINRIIADANYDFDALTNISKINYIVGVYKK